MELITPYDWQVPICQKAADSLEKNRVFISGLPTGAGKTIIALDAAHRTGGPHLVVAPKVALTQWRRTAEAMGVSDLIYGIINPERISKPGGCEFYDRERLWRLRPGTTVVWDEPHRSASGIKSLTTRAVAELRAFGARLHLMSATLADSPLKLRAAGYWCGLHKFVEDDFYHWCRKHGCTNVEIGYGRDTAGRVTFQFTKNQAEAAAIMAGIRADMGDRFMSLKADDIPGFPTETVAVKLVDLAKRSREEIDAAYAEMSERMRSKAAAAVAENGRERERIEWVMAETVAEIAADYAAAGNSVVVFFNFTEPRLRFEAKVREFGVALASVHGDQNDTLRQAGIDAFQRNEIPVMSVMAEAGGASLSLHDELHARPRVSLIMPSWNSATVKQCLGRIRRCNGTHATQFFVLAAGTVQERVAATLRRKLNNLTAFNDGLCDDDLQP